MSLEAIHEPDAAQFAASAAEAIDASHVTHISMLLKTGGNNGD